MRWAAALLVLAACAPETVIVRHEPPLGAPPTRTMVAEPLKAEPSESSDAELRAVATRFVEATEKKDYAAVRGLLVAPLRERYSAQRLAADHDREPLAKERVQRVKQALAKPFVLEGSRAHLPLDSAHALELIKEDGAWRIAALE